jgi:hypothetical protein
MFAGKLDRVVSRRLAAGGLRDQDHAVAMGTLPLFASSRVGRLHLLLAVRAVKFDRHSGEIPPLIRPNRTYLNSGEEELQNEFVRRSPGIEEFSDLLSGFLAIDAPATAA